MNTVIQVHAGMDREAAMQRVRAALDEALRRSGVVTVTVGPSAASSLVGKEDAPHARLVEQILSENPHMTAEAFATAVGVRAPRISRIRAGHKLMLGSMAAPILAAHASGKVVLGEESVRLLKIIRGPTS